MLFTLALIGRRRGQAGNKLTACLREKQVGTEYQWRVEVRDKSVRPYIRETMHSALNL